MAKIGLRHFRYGILTEAADGTATYNGAHTPGKAVSFSASITNNDAKLFADDVLAESDTRFQSGTATMGIDDEDLETMATLLGHTITNGEMISNSNDTAPYVGVGRIVVKMIGGATKYLVKFFRKVKFSEPSEDDTTKGESLELGTSEIEGQISTLKNGDWKASKTFDTENAAIEYLEGLLSAPVSAPKLTNLAPLEGMTGSITPAFDPDTLTYTSTATGLMATAGSGVAIAFFKGETAKSSGTGSVTQLMNDGASAGSWTIVVGTGTATTTYNLTVTAG